MNIQERIRAYGKWLQNPEDEKPSFDGADMRRADMRGADMRLADMRWANMRWAVGYILGPQRNDGYRFDLRIIGKTWRVVAGCNALKNWTTDQYRAHAAKYSDPAKTAETLAILDYLDARAKQEPVEPEGAA